MSRKISSLKKSKICPRLIDWVFQDQIKNSIKIPEFSENPK